MRDAAVFPTEIRLPHARTPAIVLMLTAATALAQMAPTAPSAAPPRTAMTPPATAPATGPASRPGDEAAIRAALTTYNTAVAAGDAATLQNFVVVSTDGQRSAMALMGRLTTSGRGVYQAAVEKFGEKALLEESVDRKSFPAGFPAFPVDALDIRPEGDRATLVIRSAADAPPLAMKRVGESWKIDGDALLPAMTDKQLKEQTMVLDAAIAEIDSTTADVKAGHLRGPDEVVVLMNHRVQKAVRAAQAKLAPMADPTDMVGPAGPTTAPAK